MSFKGHIITSYSRTRVVSPNKFVYLRGASPTLAAFETRLGYPLVNGVKVDDTIMFDNTGYDLLDFANCDLLSVTSLAVLGGANAMRNNEQLVRAYFPNCIDTQQNFLNGCYSLLDVHFPALQIARINTFLFCNSLSRVHLPSLQTLGPQVFAGQPLRDLRMPSLVTIQDTSALSFVLSPYRIRVEVPISFATSGPGGTLEPALQALVDRPNDVDFVFV